MLAAGFGYAHASANMLLVLAEVAFLDGAIGVAETHTQARLLIEQQLGNLPGVGSCYEAQGVLELSQRNDVYAIRQFEQALRLYDKQLAITIRWCSTLAHTYADPPTLMNASPADLPFRDRVSSLARDQLGDDARFEQLWTDGSKLTLEQAADEALAWVKQIQGPKL